MLQHRKHVVGEQAGAARELIRRVSEGDLVLARNGPWPLCAFAFRVSRYAFARRRCRPPETRTRARTRGLLLQARAGERTHCSAARPIEAVEIRENRAQYAERRCTEESIALANVIPDGAIVVTLDQRGENLDSLALAALLREWRAEHRAAVCFIVGGADGVGQVLLSARGFASPLAPPPGRISWCASCCLSSFTAPARSSPATPITGHKINDPADLNSS